MHLGFIGLGHLGKAIAGRLLDCGHTLTAWNRSTDKAQGLKATLAASPGDSLSQGALTAKKTKLLNEDFSTHFSNALIYKDLHCLQLLANEEKHPLFTGAVTKELYARTFAAGIDGLDFSSIYRLFKQA